MEKDLIIGGASNYTWRHLQYWVNSIRQSGFRGDVVLVATNISKETIDKLTSEGVQLELYGVQNPDGSFSGSGEVPHVARFFYIWNYLNNNKGKYRYVITTDVKDVVFQSDPIPWLLNREVTGLVCSSEGMVYKSEPWGSKNLFDTFGGFFHDKLKENMIYNVGVIAGVEKYVRDLMLMIFQMSLNRPISIVDQAVYNFLLSQSMFNNISWKTTNDDGWAIQLGTTIHAIESGAGDIGQIIKNDPSQKIIYQMNYLDTQPNILEDDVCNDEAESFVIVHQYDRVNGLKEKIQAKYGDK